MADVLSVIADVLKQDKQQKREHNKIMKEVQKKLKEKGSEEVAEEEGDKEEYMKFFAGKLKKYGVKSPSELSDEDKKKFFDEIDKGWKGDNEKPEPGDKKEESLGKRVKARMEDEKKVGMTGYKGEDSEDEDDYPECIASCPGVDDINPDMPTEFCTWVTVTAESNCYAGCTGEDLDDVNEVIDDCTDCLASNSCNHEESDDEDDVLCGVCTP